MTTKTKRPRINHADKVYKLYCDKNKGLQAAFDYADKHNIDFEFCKACDAERPSVKHTCAICGQTTKIHF